MPRWPDWRVHPLHELVLDAECVDCELYSTWNPSVLVEKREENKKRKEKRGTTRKSKNKSEQGSKNWDHKITRIVGWVMAASRTGYGAG
jgi:hypothetical protein